MQAISAGASKNARHRSHQPIFQHNPSGWGRMPATYETAHYLRHVACGAAVIFALDQTMSTLLITREELKQCLE